MPEDKKPQKVEQKLLCVRLFPTNQAFHPTPALATYRFKFLKWPFRIGSMVVKQAIRPKTPSNKLNPFPWSPP
jgi:hypothetical protein